MVNLAEILKANPVGVFATLHGEKIKTRVFQYLFADGRKVYFCTSSDKPVYEQMQSNPNVSFCSYPQDFAPVLSLSGKAVFTEDSALKTKALDENPPIKEIYKSPDNPIFKIFYIDVEEYETFSYAEGTKRYKV
jgi:uncharacterized pyridoxamine 5'-phosphate oxidase family protein